MKVFEGHIVDIIGKRIFDGRISVTDGVIASIEECRLDKDKLPYILPGFIDSHVHIESSMLTPVEFAKSAVDFGVIGVITDPHEIANVLGVEGVEFMIDNGSKTNFNFCWGAPSCVPSCNRNIETNGAILSPVEVEALLEKEEIGYLSEMMNFPGVLSADPQVLAKIEAARKLGKPVDGHAPGLLGEERAKYAAAGISTDHECTQYEEGLSCVQNGMFVQIRDGSAARNFDALIPLLATKPELVMFCTDDIHPGDAHEGTILSSIKKALARGYDLWSILRAASLNPQRHYNLNWGLLRVGDPATFVMSDSLSEGMNIIATYIKGDTLKAQKIEYDNCPNCFNACEISATDIDSAKQENVPVIVASDGELFTRCEYAKAQDSSYPWEEVQKIVVLNRYEKGAAPAVGYIRGFNIRNGAIAASVAHDCHNIVAIGSSDENIVRAVNEIVKMKGGVAVLAADNQLATLELPIAGLISTLDERSVSQKMKEILKLIVKTGCTMKSPLITMSFMCLPVIPQLKITDRGLVNLQ